MKYYAMWHPVHRWGPTRVPVLMAHKIDAVRGTGLTLKKMRDLGWKWVVIEARAPIEEIMIDPLMEKLDDDREAGDERDGDTAVPASGGPKAH